MAFPIGKKDLSLIQRDNQNIPIFNQESNPSQFLRGEEVANVLDTIKPLTMSNSGFYENLERKGVCGDWLKWGVRFENEHLMDILYTRQTWIMHQPKNTHNHPSQRNVAPTEKQTLQVDFKFTEHQVDFLISRGEEMISVMVRAIKNRTTTEKFKTKAKPSKRDQTFFHPEICFSTEDGSYRFRPVYTARGDWSVYLGRIKRGRPRGWMLFNKPANLLAFLNILKKAKNCMNCNLNASAPDIIIDLDNLQEDYFLASSDEEDEGMEFSVD